MKKILLGAALLVAGITNVNAQEGHLKIGAHVGLPVGDLADGYKLNLGLDVAYLWEVNDNIELGATTGLSNYFGKKIKGEILNGYSYEFDIEDSQIIPLAATAKFNIANNFFLGSDLGYALFLGDDTETGAFYYQPKVGFDFNDSEVYLSYKGMSKGGVNIASINIGYAYNF